MSSLQARQEALDWANTQLRASGDDPASVRSYRDTVRLLLPFIAADKGCRITRLALEDLTSARVLRFLRHLEEDRGNHVRTRNQRLAALHTLFEYIANRVPEMLSVCQQVAAIPMKRSAPPEYGTSSQTRSPRCSSTCPRADAGRCEIVP